MTKTRYVATPKLEDYKKVFEEHLVMERRDGILQVRLATHGGPLYWSFQAHQALAEAWAVIGHDPENEVLILTGTDPYWIGEFDHESFAELEDDPNDVEAHSALAYIYAQQDRLNEAIAENQEVLELLPEDYDSWKNLAVLYNRQEQWSEALAAAQKARSLAPQSDLDSWDQFIADLENQPK